MSGAEPALLAAAASAAPAAAGTAATGAALGAGALGAGAGLGAAGTGAGLLAGEAAATGLLGSGMAGGLGSGFAGIPLAAEVAAPTIGAHGALSFTTPSVFSTGSGLAGLSTMPTGAAALPAGEAAMAQGMQWMKDYGPRAGKAMLGMQQFDQSTSAPQGSAPPPIQAPRDAAGPTPMPTMSGGNQFARMLAERRRYM